MAIRAYTWVVTNEHTTQAEPYESMTIRDDSAWATNEAIEEIEDAHRDPTAALPRERTLKTGVQSSSEPNSCRISR